MLDSANPFNGEQNTPELQVKHPGKLTWPGGRYPAIGRSARILDKREMANLPVLSVFHFHLFDLRNPADQQYYAEVAQRVVNGWFRTLVRTQPQIDPQTRSVVFYMEWLQRYTDLRQQG